MFDPTLIFNSCLQIFLTMTKTKPAPAAAPAAAAAAAAAAANAAAPAPAPVEHAMWVIFRFCHQEWSKKCFL